MRRFTYVLVSIALLFANAVSAQDVLVVEPGVGTLNAAIAANGGNKIYQLQAGQWYQLDAIIENVDYHLQIIGQKPVNGGMPATLQTNTDAGGGVFNKMFDAKGDITLKNIYFVNADLSGVSPIDFLHLNKDHARMVVDHCIIDPVSGGNGLVLAGGDTKTYFTNNLCIRQGHMLNPNCGHFFIAGNPNEANMGLDTLLVENNTFVCAGTNMFAGGFSNFVHNYIKWNHNTWVMQKSQIDWSIWENEMIITNNLMYDFQTQPWAANWQPMPGGDAGQPKPALLYIDTIPGETFPSKTVQYIEYNMHGRNPKFYPLIDELNAVAKENGKQPVNLMPLLWPEDSLNAVLPTNIPRETALFMNKEAFPHFNYGHTMTDVDPGWEDPEIYVHSDMFVEWTRPASMIHALGLSPESQPPVTTWAQYFWDPDGDASINEAWPVFNGKYTNETLRKDASMEVNIPLGDLNWWPEAKAAWMAKYDEIEAHRIAGNTDRIDIGFKWTSAKEISSENFIKLYPNPVADQLKLSKIADEVVISDMMGRRLKTVKNVNTVSVSEFSNGIYFVSVKAGGNSSTHKIVVQK
ncbi:hypothetical protein MASR2M47_00540 [Draconibacterium sp.]|jgi:hypothetical protein